MRPIFLKMSLEGIQPIKRSFLAMALLSLSLLVCKRAAKEMATFK